jgi:aminoglycoside phosphotransferase (APT) family kinase protein
VLEALVSAGGDLAALARERGPLRRIEELTRRPPAAGTRAAFALDFADGSRAKGRRVQSAERARQVERLLAVLGDGFPRVLARRGDALLLEWIEGPTLDALPSVASDTLRRAGERLGAVHRLDASALGEDPAPDVGELLARLERDTAALVAAQRLDATQARQARVLAAAHRPARTSTGVVHRDFCAENLVLAAGGVPVCIDNASLAIGAHDLDVARTWVRWPMSREAWAHFAAGYEKHRALDGFVEHFAFWAACALAAAAAKRLRLRACEAREPLARLLRLLEVGSEPGGAAAAFGLAR